MNIQPVLAWLTVWTGFAMWPTHIDMQFEEQGDISLVRFVRDGAGDEWFGMHGGVEYKITRPQGGTFQIEDDLAVVASLGDDFWNVAEHSAVFSSGAGVITINSFWVDWLDVRVIWAPVIIGFLAGMLFDLCSLPAYLVLRTVAVGSRRSLPATS